MNKIERILGGETLAVTDSESSDSSEEEEQAPPPPPPPPSAKSKKPKTSTMLSMSQAGQFDDAEPAPLTPPVGSAPLMLPVKTEPPTKYVIPRHLVPKMHGKDSPRPAVTINSTEDCAFPAIDSSEVANLTRSLEAMKISLAAAENRNSELTAYTESMKETLETALCESAAELERTKEYYDTESARVGKLLTDAYSAADASRDEASALKAHFKTSKAYADWKSSKGPEAFLSLPPALKAAATAAKELTNEELIVHVQVFCCIHATL